ncbi:MAG: S49 family peptidase, partial [Myxococcota bacterium]
GLMLALLVMGCQGRPAGSDANEGEDIEDAPADVPHVAVIDLSRGLPESSSGGLFTPARPNTATHLTLLLGELGDDEDVRGLFVRLGLATLPLARADAVGRQLAALRAAGKPVICHADGYGNGTMLLAARGCDEIWLSPAGGVETVGIAGQLIFGRALLDKLLVDVDFVQVGDYKGAEEPFTRNGSSPEARASLQTALGAIRASWLRAVAEGRGRTAEALGLEDGPHAPSEASSRGLVDVVGFERDARLRALERAQVSGSRPRFGPDADETAGGGLSELLRVFGGDAPGLDVAHIAVVPATGAIAMADGGGLLGGGDGIAARDLGPTLRALRRDDAVKAVVLRLDSPGGSALASDLLWNDLMALRQAKPLVVSVGGMAASGGYYMACAGTRVVVEENAIIGSIGVVGGKLSFSRSLAEVGITVENVPAVPGGTTRALYGSPFTAWDDATRDRVKASVGEIYDLFLRRIAEARGLAVEDVVPHAAGRLMGGQGAVEARLADELGGLRRALDIAQELSGAETDLPVEVQGPTGGLSELFGAGGGGGDADSRARAAQRHQLEREVARRVRRLALGPWLSSNPEIATFLATTMPLATRERALAALPFALTMP